MRWFDRRFELEEINGRERCPTYLYRWTLWKAKHCSVYLHHFVGDDWSRDLHDHPKRFISIGLWGRYIEETPGSGLIGGKASGLGTNLERSELGRVPVAARHRLRQLNTHCRKRPNWRRGDQGKGESRTATGTLDGSRAAMAKFCQRDNYLK